MLFVHHTPSGHMYGIRFWANFHAAVFQVVTPWAGVLLEWQAPDYLSLRLRTGITLSWGKPKVAEEGCKMHLAEEFLGFYQRWDFKAAR